MRLHVEGLTVAAIHISKYIFQISNFVHFDIKKISKIKRGKEIKRGNKQSTREILDWTE